MTKMRESGEKWVKFLQSQDVSCNCVFRAGYHVAMGLIQLVEPAAHGKRVAIRTTGVGKNVSASFENRDN